MREQPRPLELAQQAGAVVDEIARPEADRIRQAWDDTFGRSVLECTGKRVFGYYRWHAFSWEFTRAESAARATELYLAEQSAEWLVVPEEKDRGEGLAFKLGGSAPIDFGPCGRDLYVMPPTLDWTMVFTHEQPDFGPYFCRRGWDEAEPHEDQGRAPVSSRYLACLDHREYVDAGYRWACSMLEDTGIVQLDQEVDLERLLAASGYWDPPVGGRRAWLHGGTLPEVRRFLEEHAGHHLVYVEEERLIAGSERGQEWLQFEQ